MLTAINVTADEGFQEPLVEFLRSHPPIKEMIVEHTWYTQGGEKAVTNWFAMSWQADGYLFRKSVNEMALFERFDTNKDELITMRVRDDYSVVCASESLGLHIERARGLSDTSRRDLVTPKVRGQEVLASYALMLGLPGEIRSIVLTNDGFGYRDETRRRTVTGAVLVGVDSGVKGLAVTNEVDSITWTNEAGLTQTQEGKPTPLAIYYDYATGNRPAWFPSEIKSEAFVQGRFIPIYRVLVHRLELGMLPLTEFYPERFLSEASPNQILTANGVSFVTAGGVTKQVVDGEESHSHASKYRVFFLMLMLIVTFVPLMLFFRSRKAMK